MHSAYVINTPIDSTRCYQTIIVPDFSTTLVIHREYAGQRGRGSAWRTEPVIKMSGIAHNVTNLVSFDITSKELAGLQAGIFTSVGTKALVALDNSQPMELDTHKEVVNQILAPHNAQPVVTQPVAQPVITQPIAEPTVPTPTRTINTVERKVATRQVNLATVPDSKWAEEYINRKVIGNLTEFDIYDEALQSRSNVLITGHAGSGKTMSVMAYASARNLKFYSVSAHAGIDVSQVFGKFNPTGDPDEPFAWFDGGLTQCVREGNAVLLFNEINFLPERFTTVVFSLLDDRREISLMDKDGEVVKAGDNLLIVGDMNPNYRGTRQLNQAFADRFSQHRLTFEYDPSIERKLIKNQALLDMAGQLRARFDKEELTTPISTRSLVAFVKNLNSLGFEYAKYSYLNSFTDLERPSVALVVETHESGIKESN